MRIDIPTGRGKGRSVPLTAERLINMYAEVAPAKSKSPAVLHGTPGFIQFAEITGRVLIRGVYRTVDDGVLYVVASTKLYSINSSGAPTELGIIAGSGRVGMADNGTQLCIVSGAKGYIYDTTNGLSEISDTDFPGADTVTFIDGFFVFNNSNPSQKSQFFISDLLDGKTYDALDFATAERYPDSLLRVFADHSELLLFGEESIEIWFNAGNADFPFARAQGSVIEQGLGARWAVEKVDESVVWLDNEGMVRRLTGINPERISTHAIENAISKGDWTNATSWSYVDEGHQFFVLNVPKKTVSQKAGTYVYDAATGLWHERQSYELDNCRLGFYANAYGKHIAGDLYNGKLYEMSLDIYDEDGEPLIAELQFPQVQNDGDRFTVDKLQLDMEVGVGGALTGGSNAFWSLNAVADIDDYTFSPSIAAQTSLPRGGCSFNASGTKVYLSGIPAFGGNGTVYQYSLSTPYDVTTMTYDGVDYSLGANGQVGVVWNDTGTSFITCFYTVTANGFVTQHDCSTPYDISTASYSGNSLTVNFRANGAAWGNKGTKLYVVDKDPGAQYVANSGIIEYTCSTPYDLSTATLVAKAFPFVEADLFGEAPLGLFVAPTGKSLFMCCDNSQYMLEIPLNTAWDITSYTTGIRVGLGGIANYPVGPSFDPNAKWLYVVDDTQNRIVQWRLLEAAETVFPTNAFHSYDPQVMLGVSGNTRTFGMTQKWRSMGKTGEYDKRVIWRRLGQHRSFTPRIRISSPVKRAVFTAYAKIRPAR